MLNQVDMHVLKSSWIWLACGKEGAFNYRIGPCFNQRAVKIYCLSDNDLATTNGTRANLLIYVSLSSTRLTIWNQLRGIVLDR